MKYKQWVNKWSESYLKSTVKTRTATRYVQILYQHILPYWGEYELSSITPFELQKFVTDLIEHGNLKTGGGLSSNTVNAIINVMHSSLKAAKQVGVIENCATEKIKRPKIYEKKVLCFTLQEQKKIEKEIMNDKRSKMFGIILCLYSGLRIGELLALEWNDIDFNFGTLSVNKTCYDGHDERGKYVKIIDTPKTISSVREIPLSKQMLSLLKDQKKKSNSKYVVSNGKNGILVRSYQKTFELFLNKIGVEHKGFHALRHTFATRAIECGMDVKSLSEILGHKSPTITLNRYAHSLWEHKKNMMNVMCKKLQITF